MRDTLKRECWREREKAREKEKDGRWKRGKRKRESARERLFLWPPWFWFSVHVLLLICIAHHTHALSWNPCEHKDDELMGVVDPICEHELKVFHADKVIVFHMGQTHARSLAHLRKHLLN